jgi:hypothetical protein
LRNKSFNLAVSPPDGAFSAKDAAGKPAVRAGVDHIVARAMPAFPDWQRNRRRVKEIGLIESDLDL